MAWRKALKMMRVSGGGCIGRLAVSYETSIKNDGYLNYYGILLLSHESTFLAFSSVLPDNY